MKFILLLATTVWGQECSPHDPEIVQDANFVISELQKLSDSGIYRSLTLHRIAKAHKSMGIYHNNTYLTLELASPWFQSQKTFETFEIIVMHDDSDASFAIDEFPVMDDDAVEMFQHDAIQQRKHQRERHFERILRETTQDEEEDPLKDTFIFQNSKGLIEDLRTAAAHKDRWKRAEAILHQRDKDLKTYYLTELTALDSQELDIIANDVHDLSDRRSLAAALLDSRLKP